MLNIKSKKNSFQFSDESVVITDKNADNQNSIFWNSIVSKNRSLSILEYLEQNSDIIKNRYKSIINEIPDAYIKGKKISDFFKINPNYSMFWSSDIYEKSIYKNSSIVDQLKLLALQQIFEENNFKKIIIDVESNKIANSIRLLCEQYKIKYSSQKKIDNDEQKKSIFFLSIISLIKFVKFLYFRFTFKKINLSESSSIKNKKIFLGYSGYTNLNKKQPNFNSEYWNPIIKKQDDFKNILWCNIYFHKNKESIRDYIRAYKNNKYVFFLEQLFDLKILYLVIYYWIISIIQIFQIIPKLKNYLFEKNFNFLSNYIVNEFTKSFIGIEGLASLYYFFLFEKLSKKKNISKIFYLFENQGWEKSLLFNFKNACTLVAVNHASIRHWDLRFTYDNLHKEFVTPSFYGANGNDSFKKLLDSGFPNYNILKLEALRYYNLLKNLDENIRIENKTKNILIVSDFSDESNLNLLDLISNIDYKLLQNLSFTLKEHPLKKLKLQKNVNFKTTKESLLNLRKSNEIAIVSNTTSAVIDLHLLNYKIISIIDQNSINLSPMRNNKNVLFISNFNKISNILRNLNQSSSNHNVNKDFFYYNSDLKMWKNILNHA